jgi:hypothetical protein
LSEACEESEFAQESQSLEKQNSLEVYRRSSKTAKKELEYNFKVSKE